MSEIEIEGEITVASSDDAAYAQVLDRLSELDETISALDENAILTNNDFDDTWGFWSQVQNGHGSDLGDKREDSILVHQRSLIENYKNLDVSPAIVTQTKVSYNPAIPTGDDAEGELFTRVASGYHELIAEGKAVVPHDSSSPNFTAFAASAYNKCWGGVGTTAITGRVQDMPYKSTDIPTGYEDAGSNKICGGFFAARKESLYSQGHAGTSYAIGLESQIINAPANIKADALDSDYYGNPDSKLGTWDAWTNGFHEVVGGTRPVSAAIMINGFSSPQRTTDQSVSNGIDSGTLFTLRNGTYNGIIIGASCMQIRGGVPYKETIDGEEVTLYTSGNSHETVGINTANWSVARHGFYLLKHGYSGRILKANSAALFEAKGAKFFNAGGSMPFAISCVDTYTYKDDNNQTQTAHGTPYLDFKIGSNSDFYNNSIPLERPTDATRARVGYLSSTSSLNVSSDGAIKLITSRNFADSEAETLDFTMSNNGFYPSETVNLGSANYFWDNAFVRKGAVNVADDEKYRDTSSIVRPPTAGNTEVEKILTAWGNVGYKIFKFLDTNSKKHIGLSAQDISAAFTAQGLTASNYGLYFTTTSGSTTTYGVRYNECLAMECAYLRDQLDSVKARLTALENA